MTSSRTRGLSSVRWVTVGTSRTRRLVTLEQYERALPGARFASCVARGLRDHILLMGGDLIESSAVTGSNHRFWFDYMADEHERRPRRVLGRTSTGTTGTFREWSLRLRTFARSSRGAAREARKPVVRDRVRCPRHRRRARVKPVRGARCTGRTGRRSPGRTSPRSSSSGSTSFRPSWDFSGAGQVGRVLGPLYARATRGVQPDRACRGRLAAVPGLPRAAPAPPDDAARLAGRAGRSVGGRRLAPVRRCRRSDRRSAREGDRRVREARTANSR